MKPVIIFGAGYTGRKLLKRLPRGAVAAFADNDPAKVGRCIECLPTFSFDEMRREAELRCSIVLSVDSEEMREQLAAAGLSYWEVFGEERNYLMRPDVVQTLDETLLDRFLYDKEEKDSAYLLAAKNWFREEYCSEDNRRYVDILKSGSPENLIQYLEAAYTKPEIFSDEFYENRPGMRLTHRLIRLQLNVHEIKASVCDLACGHGQLLQRLKADGWSVTGVEQSTTRVSCLKDLGIPCLLASVDHVPCDGGIFDAVVCHECLEHVADPFAVVKEMKRLLKPQGMAYCTVPYGRNCESKMHVRQFDASGLSSLFKMNGFEVINVIRIPYLL